MIKNFARQSRHAVTRQKLRNDEALSFHLVALFSLLQGQNQ